MTKVFDRPQDLTGAEGTQLGPTVAVSRRLKTDDGDVMVTVVGEIPLGTAERVALSMRTNGTEVQAAQLTRDSFNELAQSHPHIVQRLLTNMALDLAARFRSTHSKVVARQQAR